MELQKLQKLKELQKSHKLKIRFFLSTFPLIQLLLPIEKHKDASTTENL